MMWGVACVASRRTGAVLVAREEVALRVFLLTGSLPFAHLILHPIFFLSPDLRCSSFFGVQCWTLHIVKNEPIYCNRMILWSAFSCAIFHMSYIRHIILRLVEVDL